ncbi:LCP family protein [Prauserella flavalba]|uniref:LCP family protein n=1 Tax=Prauserella flavalba TaxID=1477506 RepID=UPI0036E7544D
MYLDFSLQRVPAFMNYSGRPSEAEGTNWLLIGTDSREGLSAAQRRHLNTGSEADAGGTRTDTIMVLHIPSGAAPPSLISLPRDSLVPIHGHGQNKLNAAYALGGPTLLSRTVQDMTGLHIDHYLEIGFGGFAGMVDAVGGVRVCLAEHVWDPKINLDLPRGCQELDGARALGYMRTRAFADGDLERADHQQDFLSALISKCASRAVLLNPVKLVPLTGQALSSTSFSDGDHLQHLAQLALALRDPGEGGLITRTVPVNGSSTVPGIGSVLLWDKERANALFARLRAE